MVTEQPHNQVLPYTLRERHAALFHQVRPYTRSPVSPGKTVHTQPCVGGGEGGRGLPAR